MGKSSGRGRVQKYTNNSRLSKHSKALEATTKLSHDVARLVGQFAGTDIPVNPGDTYVRCGKWGTYSPHAKFVPVLNPNAEFRTGSLRWYRGRVFDVFKVLSVTPCTMQVIRTTRYFMFYTWSCRREEEQQTVVGLYKHPFSKMFFRPDGRPVQARTIKVMKTDADDMELFKQLDLDTAITVEPSRGYRFACVIESEGAQPTLVVDYD